MIRIFGRRASTSPGLWNQAYGPGQPQPLPAQASGRRLPRRGRAPVETPSSTVGLDHCSYRDANGNFHLLI